MQCGERSGRPRRPGRGCMDFRPWLIGCQVLPPSSVRKAPAAEMAMNIRSGSFGSRRMVCRHMPPAPGCHFGPDAVAAQSGKFLPAMTAVGRSENGSVFDSRVNGVGVVERRFEMPDAFEFPGMLRAVVPLMRGQGLAGFGGSVVDEFIAFAGGHAAWTGGHATARCLPGLAAIVRALDALARTSRWFATHIDDWDRRAILSDDKSPSRRSAGR